jgi:Cupredoxin-like domain
MASGIRAGLVLAGGLLFTAALAMATQYNLMAIALGTFGSILFALREGFTGAPRTGAGTPTERAPKGWIWFVVVVALALISLAPVLGAFSPTPVAASGAPSGGSSPGGGGSTAATTCGNPCVIQIVNSKFGTGSQLAGGNGYVVVKAGTTVTWENKDVTQHTTTSNTGLWDSGILNPGQSFSHTFSSPGQYNYFCNVHPMSGTVLVVS